MTRETAGRLTAENINTLYGFALSRLGDTDEAEELTAEIISALLSSLERLRDDEKFYSFMWKVAQNTYVAYIRSRARQRAHYSGLPDGADEDIADERSVEADVLMRDDIRRLRRELSLLSENYRRATVCYYIDGLSCRETAERLGVSTEMVKYYLFRARKQLKENIDMERVYGEKSYAPHPFEIDFWGSDGGDDSEYREFKKRKLLGNILLAAYYTPMTAKELSLELGVALPYLEDELALLIARGYLVESREKYRTNIPIFTDECEAEIIRSLSESVANEISPVADSFADALESFSERFGDRFIDEAHLGWTAFTLCSHFAFGENAKYVYERFGDYPTDSPYRLIGTRGFIWGRSFERPERRFEGIYDNCSSHDRRAVVTAYNFGQLSQNYCGIFLDPVSCAAVGCFDYLPEEWKPKLEKYGFTKDGKPQFAIFTRAEERELSDIFAEASKQTAALLRRSCDAIASTAGIHAPEHIRRTAEHIGAIIYQHDSLYYIADALIGRGMLEISGQCRNPAMYAIVTNENNS